MLGGFWGAGSVPRLAQHQLRQAVLTHFICQHGGRFLPCNQKHGRDSLPCQLSPESNSAFSSGVGGSTNQRPWLLMTPGSSRDLRFISKAPVHEAISLWQFIFVLLEQWLRPAPAKPVQPGWMEMGRWGRELCRGAVGAHLIQAVIAAKNWGRKGRIGIRSDIVDLHMVKTVSINLGEWSCISGGEVQQQTRKRKNQTQCKPKRLNIVYLTRESAFWGLWTLTCDTWSWQSYFEHKTLHLVTVTISACSAHAGAPKRPVPGMQDSEATSMGCSPSVESSFPPRWLQVQGKPEHLLLHLPSGAAKDSQGDLNNGQTDRWIHNPIPGRHVALANFGWRHLKHPDTAVASWAPEASVTQIS